VLLATTPQIDPATQNPLQHTKLIKSAGAVALLTSVPLWIWFGLPTMPEVARLSFIVFWCATVAWTVLRLPDTPVAIAACLALVGLRAVTPEVFYASLGDNLIWLLVGAFILAAVLRQSGLAQRFALQAVASSSSVRSLFYRLTAFIALTAFVVPSTSGRAALLLPVFLALAEAVDRPRIVRALALLFPTVILLSACASLLGAGAHLVAVEFMRQSSGTDMGFIDWALLGTPFATISCLIAAELILRLFLTSDERSIAPELPAPQTDKLSHHQTNILLVTGSTIALWATGSLHGVDASLIALGGALVATVSAVTGVSMKQAMKSVEWNLILFLAATLVMGQALLSSGAARFAADAAAQALPAAFLSNQYTVAIFAAIVSVFAHLLITSRTARATVLIPAVALPMAAGDMDVAAMIFITVVGSGFCQTFSVSAKPVALFAGQDVATYAETDLIRLASWLAPVTAVLLAAFAVAVWPLLGLPLQK
jgi:solute carrier family 13 (sodium-dependent dicarboxylate transporter), member 2/3/5